MPPRRRGQAKKGAVKQEKGENVEKAEQKEEVVVNLEDLPDVDPAVYRPHLADDNPKEDLLEFGPPIGRKYFLYSNAVIMPNAEEKVAGISWDLFLKLMYKQGLLEELATGSFESLLDKYRAFRLKMDARLRELFEKELGITYNGKFKIHGAMDTYAEANQVCIRLRKTSKEDIYIGHTGGWHVFNPSQRDAAVVEYHDERMNQIAQNNLVNRELTKAYFDKRVADEVKEHRIQNDAQREANKLLGADTFNVQEKKMTQEDLFLLYGKTELDANALPQLPKREEVLTPAQAIARRYGADESVYPESIKLLLARAQAATRTTTMPRIVGNIGVDEKFINRAPLMPLPLAALPGVGGGGAAETLSQLPSSSQPLNALPNGNEGSSASTR